MNNQNNQENILTQLTEQIDETAEEVIELAYEELDCLVKELKEKSKNNLSIRLSLSRGDEIINFIDDKELINFVNFSKEENNYTYIKEYLLEILKAYGCCSQNILADDLNSKKIILDLEKKNPELIWIKKSYYNGVKLEDINEELNEDKQALVLYQERLTNWLF